VIRPDPSGSLECHAKLFLRVRDAPSYLRGVYEPSLDNSMLVTPTLEWQDRLANSYAWTDEPETSTSGSSPPFHVGGQPSFQRRRLDQESTPPNWGPPYKLEPVSGVCDIPAPGVNSTVFFAALITISRI
jgi:hypothetical protein